MIVAHRSRLTSLLRALPMGLVCLTLAACGGGGASDQTTVNAVPHSADAATSAAAADSSVPRSSPDAPPAWLNTQSLQAAEATAKSTTTPLEKIASGQLAAWSDYANGNVAQKSAAVAIPVYRFYNTTTTAHFYTTSETEKANILATLPQFSFDGPAFNAASESAPGLSPVYRFYNVSTGVHFYTISETEKNNIVATLPQYHLEGPAYYASQVPGRGLTALYRFYVPSKGFHFYTASSTERDNIIATLAATYQYEGPAYYVPSSTWAADLLPHTGLTSAQCYGTNNLTATDFFGTCGLIALTPTLYAQQDSARTTHNPMSYGSVIRLSGLFFIIEPKTNCVYDNVTGLTWEGKTDDGGTRDKDNVYTNTGGASVNDASGYVNVVNGMSLCGFTDWRLPTTLELLTLNNYGSTGAAPFVDPTWFPNTVTGYHWTGETHSSNFAWEVTTGDGQWEGYTGTSSTRSVRLVRGTMGSTSGGRYSFTTLAYGTDAANNVVNDHLTGLQWRRCVEGQTWNGTTCTGTGSSFTHRNALLYANGNNLRNSGWRIPNAKEAASLIKRSAGASPWVDGTAFPGVGSSAQMWTSTAKATDGLNYAYRMAFSEGYLEWGARTNTAQVRLVR